MRRTKVAILGGGPAGLLAAYELLEKAADRNDYEITVYQMGWRVGGKGTSGYRHWIPPGESAPIWNRIEEHGLHILFGFYENVFTMMRKCYEELGRPGAHPLASFEDAFQPRDFATMMYRHRSRWKIKNVWFSRNTEVPGRGKPVSDDDQLDAVSGALMNFLLGWLLPDVDPSAPLRGLPHRIRVLINRVVRAVMHALRRFVARHPSWVLKLLQFWQGGLRRVTHPFANLFGDTYLLWLGADFGAALLIGLIKSELVDSEDFSALNDRDLAEWLSSHGIHWETVASPFVSMIYHAAFSYEGGEPQRPRVAAGDALRLVLHAMTRYKGSAYYKMCGGMGEVIFVPLYQMLRRRGVRFEFFHKLESLHLDETSSIDSIELTRQARLADPSAEYRPTVEVNGVSVFPSTPLYDQLERPEELGNVRFDSYYQAQYPTGEKRVLRKRAPGAREGDFDHVILATPVATLPYVAKELVDTLPRWRDMVQRVRSVQTVSMQVWFNKPHRDLGWPFPNAAEPHTLLSMYTKPLSTWATMDQTLPREQWPAGTEPKAVSYFTGAQPGPEFAPNPADDPNFPDKQDRSARIHCEAFIQHVLAEDLLPDLEDPMSPPLPRFELLHDPDKRQGTARMAAQYMRSNCEPAERCTLALPDSTRFRMKPADTGVRNLVMAGDWVDNGIQLACMEGAFKGGRLAGEALHQRVTEERESDRPPPPDDGLSLPASPG